MGWNCELPEKVRQALFKHLGREENIRYCLSSDLTLRRVFGESYVVITDTAVAACDSTADSTSRPKIVALGDIREAKIDELFGSGRLVIATPEREHVMAYYSKVHVPEFAVICRVVNDLVQGRTPVLPDTQDAAYCLKCGRPLPERGAACPICLPRLAVFRRLIETARPYRARLALLIGLTVIGVGAEMLPPYLTKLIVDRVIRQSETNLLLPLTAAMAACGLVLLVSGGVRGVLSGWLAHRIVADLRERLHTHVQRLNMVYFVQHEPGELIARTMHDTTDLLHFLVQGAPFLVVNGLSFLAIAFILIMLDFRLALLVFLPVPVLILGGGWFWSKLVPLFSKRGYRRGTVVSLLSESINGIRAVKAFSMEPRRMKQFEQRNEALFDASFAIERTYTAFFQIMYWVMSVGMALVWFYAAWRISHGDTALTLGDLLAFVGYIALFYGPLRWFTIVLNWMSHAFSSAERVFSVLDSQPETYDAPGAEPMPKIEGRVQFDDVHFSYDRGKQVLKGVSFTAEPGEMIGLVGKSGAGKSTVISLLCRFYDPDSGRILIDGKPLDKLRLTDVRGQIGIVMQDSFLFDASILENIRCGKPSSFEEVVRAAKAANAHNFIVDKEDGYDTIIGQGGASLSGGEKQRIAIARAILQDPPILILDEATSSVDSETEKAIQEAIGNLIRNRTTFAIAHRLATLRNAKRLIVVDDGRIAEIGTHDELMNEGGIYAQLVRMQTELNRLRTA